MKTKEEEENGPNSFYIKNVGPGAIDKLLACFALLGVALTNHAPTTQPFKSLEDLLVGHRCPAPKPRVLDGLEEGRHFLLVLRSGKESWMQLPADTAEITYLRERFWYRLIPPLREARSERLQKFLLRLIVQL